MNVFFSFWLKKKKLAVLTRNALLLRLVDQKLLLRGCSFERKPTPYFINEIKTSYQTEGLVWWGLGAESTLPLGTRVKS